MIIEKLKNNSIYHAVIITFISLLAYSNTFHVPFYFDDYKNIITNPLIKNTEFLLEPSKYCLSVSSSPDQINLCNFLKRRYVGYITFAINYRLHGIQVAGYHMANYSIHIMNAFLLYILICLIFRTPFLQKSAIKDYEKLTAFFTALLFVSHPIQTQAVTYIVQRFTSLATFFYLLSIVLYGKWRLQKQHQEHEEYDRKIRNSTSHYVYYLYYLSSLVSIVLAMKTKEIAFTLPVIIIFYEFIFYSGKTKQRILWLIPFLLTMFIIPLSMISIDKPFEENIHEATTLQTNISRSEYLFTEMRVIMTYIRLIFFPVNQTIDYNYPIYRSFYHPAVFLSCIFLIVCIALGIYLLHRFRDRYPYVRPISFGIFWFMITLSVESSVIPIADIIFEHRVYLPSIGLFCMFNTVLFGLTATLKNRRKTGEMIIIIILFFLTIGLATATYARNAVWKNRITLWEDVIKKSPDNARGYYNLGRAYQSVKQYDKALEMYNHALSLNKTYTFAYFDMANIYQAKMQLDKAFALYLKIIEIDPVNYYAYSKVAELYCSTGQFTNAYIYYDKAVTLNPLSDSIYNSWGNCCIFENRYQKAIEYFSKAIRFNPGNAAYYFNRGMAYAQIGMSDFASRDIQKSCSLGNRMACDTFRKYSQ
jgi:protein O-mannosyl-transferase